MKAIASITLDDCFVIHDLRVIQGDEHLFVAMPVVKLQQENLKILRIQLIMIHAKN